MKSVWKTMRAQAKANPSLHNLYQKLGSAEGRPAIFRIGLSGGIASGKSLIASYFRKKRIPVIDADQVARDVVRTGSTAYQEIVAVFGEGILMPNREIDRQKLGQLVFTNDSLRKTLESITHPAILREILRRIAALKKKRMVVVDAALLFESGLYQSMDKNILVRVNPEVQLKRLIRRDRLSEAEAWARILAQMPTPEKERLASSILDNSGTRTATLRQFNTLWNELSALVRTP